MSSDLATAVYREAQLLDAQCWDEWLALYAVDCRYWVPLSHDQTDAHCEQSIAFEDRMLLEVRIERLKAGRAPSQHPGTRAQHVLQAPAVDATTLTTRTPFFYVEARNDTQLVFAGVATHRFVREHDALKIALKRIDLVNAHAVLPPIFLIL